MQALSKFCCQNKKCPDYGKRGANNKKRFSERKGTPLFGLRLPEEKMISLLDHISESCGVRKTSRLVGVHRDTVTRYILAAGKHAKSLHDELVAFSPRNQ